MNTNQSSSVVYGLFVEDEQPVLLGIYFLEGEAAAARDKYIEDEVLSFPPVQQDWARRHYSESSYTTKLPVGQAPSFYFLPQDDRGAFEEEE